MTIIKKKLINEIMTIKNKLTVKSMTIMNNNTKNWITLIKIMVLKIMNIVLITKIMTKK